MMVFLAANWDQAWIWMLNNLDFSSKLGGLRLCSGVCQERNSKYCVLSSLDNGHFPEILICKYCWVLNVAWSICSHMHFVTCLIFNRYFIALKEIYQNIYTMSLISEDSWESREKHSGAFPEKSYNVLLLKFWGQYNTSRSSLRM